MKLRSKLILAFLVVSVLPLAAIVLYSYVSSLEAFRQAVVSETSEMAAEMEGRMRSVREDLSWRLQRLGDLNLAQLAAAKGADGDPELVARIAEALGDAAPYLEALEFIPGPEAEGPSDRSAAAAPSPAGAAVPPGLAREGVVIFMPELTAVPPGAAAAAPASSSTVPPPPPTPLAPEELAQVEDQIRQQVGAALQAAAEERARTATELERLRREGKAQWSAMLAQAVESSKQLGGHELELEVTALEAVPIVHDREHLDPSIKQALEQAQERSKKLLGREFDCPVERGGEAVGRLRAQLASEAVLKTILARTRRDQGEIPFAHDRDGKLYVADPHDLERLEALPMLAGAEAAARHDDENWVVVRTADAESGLVYGIARPIRQSLEAIRRTAGRNFGFGLGLVALALIGVVPLSGRITRDVSTLTRGAERLAEGDLGVEVPVHSRDEIGSLAMTFNRMARELQDNQRRLVEQERLRREQELAQSLLAAENRRRGEELEEARRFQLSLLPHEVPEHPAVDIAARMRTATEVGGDYYDFQPCADGSLTVAIGDATGHGAKAGTMVTVIKSLFTAQAGECGLAEFLARSTVAIKRMSLGRMAMALSLLNVDGRRLRVAAAGMPPVLVHRAARGQVEEIGEGGLPLGGIADCAYSESTSDIAPGDTVLLMSDGFPELLNPQGEPLGYTRARAAFAASAASGPEEVIDRLFAQADAWAGRETPSDDITFVVLRARA